MPIEITMPALSPTMKDGTLSKWNVKVGDKIKAGTVIAEIETDKASMEVEAVDSGIIGKILINEGTQNVAVGTLIALLLESGESQETIDSYLNITSAEQKLPSLNINSNSDITESELPKFIVTQEITNDRIFVSPLAKRISEKESIDLTKITGTGPNGRIIKNDLPTINNSSLVDKSTLHQIIANHQNELIPHSSMRKIIASRLTESKQNYPHFYLNINCNMSALIEMRKKMNQFCNPKNDSSFNISVNDLFVKATAIALKNQPDINVSWQDNGVLKYSNIDISIAVSIPGGLITPIVKNADQIGLMQLAQTTKSLIKKAREGKLLPAEFQGGTFSISNLGMFGINEFYPIINPPQAAILSIGATQKAPIINQENQISVAEVCTIGLSVDHRAIDGAAAAEFLQFLKQTIENPIMLAL